MNTKKMITTALLLVVLAIVIGVIARILISEETLLEYAAENPDVALATVEPITEADMTKPEEETKAPAPTPDPTPEPTPEPTPAPDPSDSFTASTLSDSVKERITGISYPADDTGIRISYDDLRYLKVLYYDFNNEVQEGELICNKYIAQDLLEIFRALYDEGYQIEKIRLVDEYGGDDHLSMIDNNTSCFNYRVVENTTSLSKHALGCAIDVNPFYNPYIVYGKGENGGDFISPEEAAEYVDRTKDFPHKIDENDLCCRLFKEHGFTWGGDWTSQKDYQHFQKTP